jgi:uncharacterized membrane protein
MPHCTKCGAAVADGAGFCPSCGAPAAGTGTASASAVPVTTGTSGMQENVAAGLSYVLWWVTGLIFYLTDKRKFVRFHAAQSIVLFGAIFIISIVLGMFVGASIVAFHGGGMIGAGFLGLLLWLVHIGGFILWIVCMIMAFQGKNFRVPIVADLADQIFKP